MAAPQHTLVGCIVEERTDADKVSCQDEFPLPWIPSGECPIPGQSCETFSAPSIKCASDKYHVRRVSSRGRAESGNEILSIVEPAIPCDDHSASRAIGLAVLAGFLRDMKGPIQHSERAIYPTYVTVGFGIGSS